MTDHLPTGQTFLSAYYVPLRQREGEQRNLGRTYSLSQLLRTKLVWGAGEKVPSLLGTGDGVGPQRSPRSPPPAWPLPPPCPHCVRCWRAKVQVLSPESLCGLEPQLRGPRPRAQVKAGKSVPGAPALGGKSLRPLRRPVRPRSGGGLLSPRMPVLGGPAQSGGLSKAPAYHPAADLRWQRRLIQRRLVKTGLRLSREEEPRLSLGLLAGTERIPVPSHSEKTFRGASRSYLTSR